MSPALETLLLACAGRVPDRALFLGAEAHPDLRRWPNIVGWQPQKPLADRWERAGFSRIDDPSGGCWPAVLLLPGKCRDENLAWFALARDRLEPGGRIVVAMPNALGAGRFEKTLAKATGGRVESISKHKCRAFSAVDDGSWDGAIFAEWLALLGWHSIPGTDWVTQAGIFSSEHVDPGSRLLAEHLPADLAGTVADLGAGWGFLSAELLRRCPGIERLDLFESDSRALDCARLNLARATVPLGFHWHDVTTGLPGSYDAIAMNPPFHSGHATDIDLGRAFVRAAAAVLKPGGRLFLVANRHLPYEAAIAAAGLTWRSLAEDRVFKVLAAGKGM